jgi:hypothetical protein
MSEREERSKRARSSGPFGVDVVAAGIGTYTQTLYPQSWLMLVCVLPRQKPSQKPSETLGHCFFLNRVVCRGNDFLGSCTKNVVNVT